MDFSKIKWNEKSYLDYIEYLRYISENGFAKFSEKSYNDKEKKVLGIRIPVLRNIAKQILTGNTENFFKVANSRNEYVEEVMIESFVIAGYKEKNEDKLKRVDAYIPKITNWAICDSFVPTLKFIKGYKEEFLKYVLNKIKSENEFELRFCIVSLMDYYLEEKNIDKVLQILDSVKLDKYYVKMAVAWAISVSYIKFKDKTLKYLKEDNNLDTFTFNKTIDKICDSYRVEKIDKIYLKKIKKPQ